MGAGRYLIILMLMLLSFIGVSLSLSALSSGLFMRELYLMLLLLVVAGVAIYVVTKRGKVGWLLFSIFFLTFIVNAVYLSLEVPMHRMTLYSVMLFSALGFLFSITPHRSRKVARPRPQVIIEDIEPLKEIAPEEPMDEPSEEKAPVKRRKRRKNSRGKAG